MIQSRKDLFTYIRYDCIANMGVDRLPLWRYIIHSVYHSDGFRCYRYLRALRLYEYILNYSSHNNNCITSLNKTILILLKYRHHRLGVKYNISLEPNVAGYGLKIMHLMGGGVVLSASKIGNNFSVRQFTTIGKRNGDDKPIIGDNVTVGANVVIIGKIQIGNNCIIGAGSVVVNSAPNNSVIIGNPGRIVRKIQ